MSTETVQPTATKWRTYVGAEYDSVTEISCAVIANGQLVDAEGNTIYEDHPEISAEIRRRGSKAYRDHAYSRVPMFGCDHPATPGQPDGIEDESNDMPDPVRSADRIIAYVSEFGDGLYDVVNGRPLYGRDLESVVRALKKASRLRCGHQYNPQGTWYQCELQAGHEGVHSREDIAWTNPSAPRSAVPAVPASTEGVDHE